MPSSTHIPGIKLSSIVCVSCGKSVMIAKRLPHGWKRRSEEDIFCAKCWKEIYVLRAVTFAVASPLDASWSELNNVLRRMCEQTTFCSNWTVTQLALADVPRMPDHNKMLPMPRIYLYPDARRLFPELPPKTVSSLLQSITRKYLARRYEVIWAGKASLPTYRYPQPFPVHNQSWWSKLEGEWPVVVVRIGERKFRLRLKGGPRYRRPLAVFREMVSDEAKRGELALYKSGDKMLCKLVAWLPRPIRVPAEGKLVVKTMPDVMLAATNAKGQGIWTYNADHVPRWNAEHRTQLQRWSEDAKAEQQSAPAFAARRRAAVDKYHNRMRSAAYEAAAYVAGYATRRRVAAVRYDDSERRWCHGFPWEMLRTRLRTMLGERGIEFEVLTNEAAVEQMPRALATGEVDSKS